MAAVSVGGPGVRLTPERREATAAHVMEAARSISAEMGYRAA